MIAGAGVLSEVVELAKVMAADVLSKAVELMKVCYYLYVGSSE